MSLLSAAAMATSLRAHTTGLKLSVQAEHLFMGVLRHAGLKLHCLQRLACAKHVATGSVMLTGMLSRWGCTLCGAGPQCWTALQ